MAITNTIESLAFKARPHNIPSGELEPVTFQVVLLGGDGVVIASDTRAMNFDPQHFVRTTDTVSKIVVVEPHLVYIYAGDGCAKKVGAAVALDVKRGQPLSKERIEEVSNSTREEYWKSRQMDDRVDSRKIAWVQRADRGFAIWSATGRSREMNFEVTKHEENHDGKCRIFAGDEFNQARYIVEHYYDKYPLRNISGLKRLAAQTILTGELFNNAGVGGLEMVVGTCSGFARIPAREIQELAELSRTLQNEIDVHFKD